MAGRRGARATRLRACGRCAHTHNRASRVPVLGFWRSDRPTTPVSNEEYWMGSVMGLSRSCSTPGRGHAGKRKAIRHQYFAVSEGDFFSRNERVPWRPTCPDGSSTGGTSPVDERTSEARDVRVAVSADQRKSENLRVRSSKPERTSCAGPCTPRRCPSGRHRAIAGADPRPGRGSQGPSPRCWRPRSPAARPLGSTPSARASGSGCTPGRFWRTSRRWDPAPR